MRGLWDILKSKHPHSHFTNRAVRHRRTQHQLGCSDLRLPQHHTESVPVLPAAVQQKHSRLALRPVPVIWLCLSHKPTSAHRVGRLHKNEAPKPPELEACARKPESHWCQTVSLGANSTAEGSLHPWSEASLPVTQMRASSCLIMSWLMPRHPCVLHTALPTPLQPNLLTKLDAGKPISREPARYK